MTEAALSIPRTRALLAQSQTSETQTTGQAPRLATHPNPKYDPDAIAQSKLPAGPTTMSLYFGSGTGEMSSRSKSRSKMDQMVETYNRACVRCSLADVRSVFTHAHVCARASMEGEAVSIVGGVSLSSHSRRGGQARRFVNGERELAIRRAAPQLVGGCARAREAALIPRLRGRRTKGFTEASA
eukprot:6213235-Pleurochrysis_carterae.AAC.1